MKKSAEKTTRGKMIELIQANSFITIKDIAVAVGITVKGFEYQLAKMPRIHEYTILFLFVHLWLISCGVKRKLNTPQNRLLLCHIFHNNRH